jgi:hypothetical protein
VLVRAFDERLQTDYADFPRTTPEDVARLASYVRAFIYTCARLLESQFPSPPA